MRTVLPSEATLIPAQPHRPGGVSFRHLLAGPDDALDNYSLSLVDVAEHYEAPRHRHQFEQVRVMLAGRFGFGPGAAQETESVGYFCEGSYYTQLGQGASTTLLLQCGGASGTGYLGFERLQRGIRELAAKGQFHDGVFTWHDEHGTQHNQDGYEAAWEHVMGRPVRYPKARYQAPVIVEPEHFAWRPLAAGLEGVEVKRLGLFNERGLGVALWRLAPMASVSLPKASRRELMYVRAGQVTVAGRELPAGSAVEVLGGEPLHLLANGSGAELVGFSLPVFER
jgi:hypothetical protein